MIKKGKKYIYNHKGRRRIVYLEDIRKTRENPKELYYIHIKFTPNVDDIDELSTFKLISSSFSITKSEIEKSFREYNIKEKFLCMIENL
jgi:hypothetical protein